MVPTGDGVNYIKVLPNEIMLNVLSYLDSLSFARVGGVCLEWSHIKELKGVGKIYKSQCFYYWPQDTYPATKPFLNSFANWRDMLKRRGFIRSDGFYVCRLRYIKMGINDASINRPALEIVSYRYFKFFPKQQRVVSIYTTIKPAKFL